MNAADRARLTARSRVFAFPALLALLSLLSFMGAACGPSAETVEARRVLRAIDVVRDAPTEPLSARVPLIDDLERQEAKGPIAVKARDACVKAYRSLIEGKTLEERVEKQLAPASSRAADAGAGGGTNAGGGATLDTLRDLVAAEAKIKESTELMPACNHAAAELRVGPASGR